jgi:hypothetical protein
VTTAIAPRRPRAAAGTLITVVVTLGEQLHSSFTPRTLTAAETNIREDLQRLVVELGLDRELTITISIGPSARALDVRIGDRSQRYADRDVRAAWSEAVPEHLALLAKAFESAPDRLPGAWLAGVIDGLPKAARASVVGRLVRALVLRILRERPGDLFVDTETPIDAAVSGKLDPSFPERSVARYLAEQGLYAQQHPEMLASATGALGIPQRPDDLAEILNGACPHTRIQLVARRAASAIDDERPAILGLASESLETALQAVDVWLQEDFGLRLPPVDVIADAEFSTDSIAVRINDVSGIAFGLPAEGEVVIEVAPSDLDALAAPRAALLPRDLRIGSIVRASEVDRLGLSVPTSDRTASIAVVLRHELEWFIGRLVTLPAVEFALGQLEPFVPDLVQEALARFSTPEITRIVRALVDEGVSVRDLEGILERLVQFREVPMDSEEEILLDDAIPMNPEVAGDPDLTTRRLVTWVRSGLAGLICGRFSQRPGGLFVAQLDEAIDARLSLLGWEGRSVQDSLTTAEWDEAVNAILGRIRDGLPATMPAVLITSRRGRPMVRQLLAHDAPTVRVVAWTEIDWNLELVFINEEGGLMAATIALVQDRVEQILRANVEEAMQRLPDGTISLVHEGVEVVVAVEAWEKSTTVTTWAELMPSVARSAELFEYIALEASSRIFGHVVAIPLDDEQDQRAEGRVRLIFSHAILGDFLDPDELIGVVLVIAIASLEIRHELSERFGQAPSGEPSAEPVPVGS